MDKDTGGVENPHVPIETFSPSSLSSTPMPEPIAYKTVLSGNTRENATPTKGSITRQILTLALPALGSMITTPVFLLIDSAMVGHLGIDQLAGLSLASTVLNTIVGLCVFLAYTTTAATARTFGTGNVGGAIKAGFDTLGLAFTVGMATVVVLEIFSSQIFMLLGAPSEILPHAVTYLRACAPGLIGTLLTLAATGILRGLLDTKTPLVISLVGAVINTVLNALLIFEAGWGIGGSGIGTAITQLLMSAALISVIIKKAHHHGVSIRFTIHGIRGSAEAGLSLFIRSIAIRLSVLATTLCATQIGVQALASHQVVNSVWTLTTYVLDALAVAAQALVAFAIGSGSTSALKQLFRSLRRWSIGAGIVVGLLTIVCAPLLPLFFGSDPEVYAIAESALILTGITMPISSVAFLLDGVLIGASEGKFLAQAAIISTLIYVPALACASFLPPHFISDSPPHIQKWSMLGVWAAFGIVFMGVRGSLNAWRVWSHKYGILAHSVSESTSSNNASR